ncbi:cytochrome P450 [Mycena floridula]|nr:cytochrome P450 [Mycena floridula]
MDRFIPDSIVIVAIVCVLTLLYRLRARNSSLPLPPGPPSWPILGNILSIPKNDVFRVYKNWPEQLGSNVIHLNIAGSSLIVLNSFTCAKELLDARSRVYSSRPPLVMLNDLMSFRWSFGFQPDGEFWRTHRRLFDREFKPSSALRYRPIQMHHLHNFLRHLLCNPTPVDIMSDIRHVTGAATLSIAYGLSIPSTPTEIPDRLINIAEASNNATSDAAALPIAGLIDVFPWLKFIPDWMPGSGFKQQTRIWAKASIDMLEIPYATAKAALDEAAPNSFVASCLEKGMDDDLVKRLAGTIYAGGADTTVSTLGTFILNMLAHPDVQKKAQEEIDALLQGQRLPVFEDQNSLPYVHAILKESLRVKPVAPLGLPHFNQVEDEYHGYRIPARSTVVANLWGMLHDKDIFAEPAKFDPERFLKEGKLDASILAPENVVFGFGRRICPGRHIALSTIFITIASILALFDIRKAVGKDGNAIEPSHEYKSAMMM